MTLVVVKIIFLNQCRVIWNKITALLLVIKKKKKRVNYLGGWKEDQPFLGILGSVVPSRRSSVGWMPKRMGRWSFGVGRRHLVTMRKVSFRMCLKREYERCETRLVRSIQLLSRPKRGQLCAVFWHQYLISSLQVASAV